MSTRARIGIEMEDGTLISVYHHWDGYPEWLGKKLKKYYNKKEDILRLFEKGDISILESSEDWNRVKTPQKIVLYYADRGENTPAKKHQNLQSFIHSCKESGAEYAYIFNKNGNWNCLSMYI